MLKSISLKWALLGTGVMFAGLGLGNCSGSGITNLLPLILLGSLLNNNTNSTTT